MHTSHKWTNEEGRRKRDARRTDGDVGRWIIKSRFALLWCLSLSSRWCVSRVWIELHSTTRLRTSPSKTSIECEELWLGRIARATNRAECGGKSQGIYCSSYIAQWSGEKGRRRKKNERILNNSFNNNEDDRCDDEDHRRHKRHCWAYTIISRIAASSI